MITLDNRNTLEHYVSELIQINLGLLAGKSDTQYFSCITHGLVEELLELALTVDFDDKVKELGDVFAYASLILIAAELDNPIHEAAASIRDSIVAAVTDELANAYCTPANESILELALSCAGNFKRYFRGEPGYASNAFVAEAVMCAYHTETEVALADVLSVNLSKLEDRLKRGKLNVGEGDNR